MLLLLLMMMMMMMICLIVWPCVCEFVSEIDSQPRWMSRAREEVLRALYSYRSPSRDPDGKMVTPFTRPSVLPPLLRSLEVLQIESAHKQRNRENRG